MENLRLIPLLLAILLAVSTAVAQTADGPATDTLSEPSGISAARSKYLEKAADAAATKDSQTQARLPRRGPRMSKPPRRGYYGGGYPTPWMADSDPGHVLIGAGIGFAIGAAIGAVAAAENGKSVGNAVCLGGPLFALFGAAIGASHGSSHPFIHRRRAYPVWPEDDEDGSLRSPAVQKPRAMLSASGKRVLPNQPRETQAKTAASSKLPPVLEERSVQTASSPKTQQWQNFSGQLKPW